MRSTFVYDDRAVKRAGMAVGYDTFGQVDDGGPTAIPGDGGIYSTVDDLFKWDQALNTEKLVTRSTLAEAFTPARVEKGKSTYGFGWNVGLDGTNRYVWHTGSHAGFRAFIERRLNQQLTVIMLTNMGNSKRVEINAAIQNTLAGEPYILPKQSGAQELYRTIHESGIQKALRQYRVLKRGNEYDLGESELNSLGYQLLYRDRNASGAIDIFKLNSTNHPLSSNAFDSLGEAYQVNGERKHAILSYGIAVVLDPSNGHAKAMLRKLQPDRRLGWSICIIGVVGCLALLVVIVMRRRRISPSAVPAEPSYITTESSTVANRPYRSSSRRILPASGVLQDSGTFPSQRAYAVSTADFAIAGAERMGEHATPALDSPHPRRLRLGCFPAPSLLPSAKATACIAPPETSSPSRC